MKRILFFALSLLVVVSCSKFDDSAIWEELDKHEDRIVKLETLCNQMNTNITSLQTIIIALQNNDYVTNIAPIKEGNKEIGYTITFAKSGSITIYHGQDGKDGEDGKDGTDGRDGQDGEDGKDGTNGQDGTAPVIGVKQDTDGIWYWTLNGTWLLDDSGNKIPTTGKDGNDGQDGINGTDGIDGKDGVDGKDGQDGISPQLKIEDDYWYLSYDNGATWQKLGKATGNNGLDGANGADGEDGDSIIDSITQDEENVYFILSDGQLLTMQKRREKVIIFSDVNVKLRCIEHWDINGDYEISHDEAAAVSSIDGVFSNNKKIIMFNELKYFTGLTAIPSKAFEGCSELVFLTLPSNITSIEQSAFSQCISLKRIEIPAAVKTIGFSAFYNCRNLNSVIFELGSQLMSLPGENHSQGVFWGCESLEGIDIPNKVTLIGPGTFYGCKNLKQVTFQSNSVCGLLSSNDGYYGAFEGCTSLKEILLPASLIEIQKGSFGGCSSLAKVSFEKDSRLTSILGGGGSSSDYRGAFYGCIGLREFDASNCQHLSIIKDYVFTKKSTDNQSLTIDIFKIGAVTPPTLRDNVRIIDLYVPSGCKDAYKIWGATTIHEM